MTSVLPVLMSAMSTSVAEEVGAAASTTPLGTTGGGGACKHVSERQLRPNRRENEH